MTLDPAPAWLAAGLVLLVLEMVAPGAFMLWLGLAAIGTGALALLGGLSFWLQVVSFAVLATASISLGLKLRRRRRPAALNTAGAGLLGRSARVLSFAGTEGRVRVGDSDWPARLAPGLAVPPADAMLCVVGVDGVVLIVGAG